MCASTVSETMTRSELSGLTLPAFESIMAELCPAIIARNFECPARQITSMGNRRAADMYKYDDFDQGFLEARNAQFRQQVARRLSVH